MMRRTLVALFLMAALVITLRVGALRTRQVAAPEALESHLIPSDPGHAPLPIRPESAPEAHTAVPEAREPVGPLHVSGRVVRCDGAPAAGCRIELGLRNPRPGDRAGWSAIAGGNGEFRVEGLEPGVYDLGAKSEDGFEGNLKQIDVRANQSLDDVVLTLPGSRQLTVTVVDARGTGVAGARVTISSGYQTYNPHTDEFGVARDKVHGEGMRVEVYPPNDDLHAYLTPRPVGLGPAELEARFVLADGGVVTGVVWVEHLERPWSGATVVTIWGGKEISRTVSDSEGHFSAVVPLAEPASLKLEILDFLFQHEEEAGNYPEASLDEVRAGDRDLKLVLRMRAADGKLRVLAQDPDGKAIPNATVRLRMEGRMRWLTFTSNDIGVAEIERLPDAEFSIYAKPPPGCVGADEWLSPKEVRVHPAGQDVLVRFLRGIRLRGIVLGPEDKPCPGARIFATQEQSTNAEADPEGRFTILINADSPVPLSLTAWCGSGAPRLSAKLTGVDPRGGEVVIRLQREK